jgi:hypothetical protein
MSSIWFLVRSQLSPRAAAAGLVALTTGALIDDRGTGQRSFQSVAEALACARTALGGEDALASLTSLRVAFDVVPAPTNKAGQPMATELVLTFPDTFTKTDRARLVGREVVRTRGVIGDRPRGADQSAEVLRARRSEFARWAMVLLLRETQAIPLRWSREPQSDAAHVTIAATGPDGFKMGLTLDTLTCHPTAATWERPPSPADAQAGRNATAGRFVEGYELSAYKVFDGIRLPTRIRMATDGTPRFEWTITSATVRQRRPDRLDWSRQPRD